MPDATDRPDTRTLAGDAAGDGAEPRVRRKAPAQAEPSRAGAEVDAALREVKDILTRRR